MQGSIITMGLQSVLVYAYNGKHTGSIKSVKLILEVEVREAMFTSRQLLN